MALIWRKTKEFANKEMISKKTYTAKFIALGDGSFWVVERILNINL